MSYLVLARRYRPQNFDSLIGQEHITDLLKGAVTSGRLSHAYLFTGPRGIGKTSCARILAKSLNCQKGPTLNPCGECPACKEITSGTSFDVMEIDGASNRGIDEIRALRENVKFGPGYGRFKIYIVDEVHMLTTEAFNALLKTLEEPPEHVKFIFATTDPAKIPATIISRCQRYDFKRIPLKTLVASMEQICEKEKLRVESGALYAIAKAAQGSFRDALSVLDQISAFADREIQIGDVCSMLGLVETDAVFELCDALGDRTAAPALKKLDDILDQGKDVRQLMKDLVEHFRNLMVIKIGGKSLGKLVDYPIPIKEMYLAQSEKFKLSDILQAIDFLIEAQEMVRVTESQRIPLEIAFAKISLGAEAAPAGAPAASSARSAMKTAGAPATPARPAAASMIRNQKGQVNASSEPQPTDPQPAPDAVEEPAANIADFPQMSGELSLDMIKSSWDGLTHAVSRHKMSVATYLQEGVPVSFDGEKLVIGFPQEFSFHKSTLEHAEYVAFVEKIFAEKLNRKILLRYALIDGATPVERPPDEPIVQKALETFGGKITSQWHNE